MLKSILDEDLHGDGVGVAEISDAEERLGVVFSKEYREYLLGVGIGAVDGHEFTGITKTKRLNVVDVTNEERKRIPSISKSYYVVEQTNYDGVVVWQDKDGNVYESYETGEVKVVAKSVEDYINITE